MPKRSRRLELMKHVWILNHYAQEPGSPGGTRHFSLASHLPASGWNASVIAASTEHFTGRQRLQPSETARLDVYDDVPFLWLPTAHYVGNGGDRIRNMIDYTITALQPQNLRALSRPDAIIGSSVHPLAAWAGRRLARRYGVPFLFEVRDLWPQTLVDMGRLSERHPVTFALRRLEKSLYLSAEKIIVLLPQASRYIEALGVPGSKIVWIPNGVDLASFSARSPGAVTEAFTLMYFGAHGDANGLDNVIQALRLVQESKPAVPVQARLIGDGPRKPALIELARKLGLNNVTFETPVPKSDIPELAAQADAFVFNLIDAPVFKYGISSNKLFDFMAAQRPIIFSSNAASNPVAAAGAGLVVAPENPRALADAITRLAKMPATERASMGLAGRKYVEVNHDFGRLAGKLAETLDACG